MQTGKKSKPILSEDERVVGFKEGIDIISCKKTWEDPSRFR